MDKIIKFNIIKRSLLLILLVTFFGSCNDNTENGASQEESEVNIEVEKNSDRASVNDKIEVAFVHSVYFWLNEADDEVKSEAFLSSLNKFIDQSPYITTKHIGEPADTNRDIIDNTYTYSLILGFKDKAAHDDYQEEPAHQVFRDEIDGRIQKIVIYDSVLDSDE